MGLIEHFRDEIEYFSEETYTYTYYILRTEFPNPTIKYSHLFSEWDFFNLEKENKIVELKRQGFIIEKLESKKQLPAEKFEFVFKLFLVSIEAIDIFLKSNVTSNSEA